MPKTNKKPWTRPTLKRLEATDELLRLFAAQEHNEAPMSVKRMK